MKGKKTYSKQTKRTGRKRYGKPSKRYTMINPSRSVISNRYFTKLVYSQPLSLAPATHIDYHEFCTNGLYDPDITGTGHQPYGYDQLMPTLYQKYLVHGCKVIIEGSMTSTGTGNLVVGSYPANGSYSVPITLSEACERRQFRTLSTNNQKTFRFSRYINHAKVHGVKPSDMRPTANGYASSYTSNPSFRTNTAIGFCNVDGFSATATMTVTLIYYAEFFSPTSFGQS